MSLDEVVGGAAARARLFHTRLQPAHQLVGERGHRLVGRYDVQLWDRHVLLSGYGQVHRVGAEVGVGALLQVVHGRVQQELLFAVVVADLRIHLADVGVQHHCCETDRRHGHGAEQRGDDHPRAGFVPGLVLPRGQRHRALVLGTGQPVADGDLPGRASCRSTSASYSPSSTMSAGSASLRCSTSIRSLASPSIRPASRTSAGSAVRVVAQSVSRSSPAATRCACSSAAARAASWSPVPKEVQLVSVTSCAAPVEIPTRARRSRVEEGMRLSLGKAPRPRWTADPLRQGPDRAGRAPATAGSSRCPGTARAPGYAEPR